LKEISNQARWKSKRSFKIINNEFINRFPIQNVLTKMQRRVVEPYLKRIQDAGATARLTLTKKVRAHLSESGDIGHFGQHVDLIFQFLDDTWDRTTEDALEAVSGKSKEQLWCDVDVKKLVMNMDLQNSVRKVLLPEYTQQRAALKGLLPSRGNAVIYRKCKCGRVFVKPEGCDGQTTCGLRVESMILDVMTWDYVYSAGSLQFVPRDGLKKKNGSAILRGLWSSAAEMIFGLFRSSRLHSPSLISPQAAVAQGCGATIVWSEMEPVDLASTNEGEIMEMSAAFDCAAVAYKLKDDMQD
jgi:hypothetical protein